jgi:hypothetical protein
MRYLMTEENGVEAPELMSPEEMAMLKKLQAKSKAMKAAMGGIKTDLFQVLTQTFGATISKVKKDVVTISTGEPMADENIYAITFGVETTEDGDVDTKALAVQIIENHLSEIEPIMGIGNSLKIAGTFEGKKLFWQIRKRS